MYQFNLISVFPTMAERAMPADIFAPRSAVFVTPLSARYRFRAPRQIVVWRADYHTATVGEARSLPCGMGFRLPTGSGESVPAHHLASFNQPLRNRYLAGGLGAAPTVACAMYWGAGTIPSSTQWRNDSTPPEHELSAATCGKQQLKCGTPRWGLVGSIPQPSFIS